LASEPKAKKPDGGKAVSKNPQNPEIKPERAVIKAKTVKSKAEISFSFNITQKRLKMLKEWVREYMFECRNDTMSKRRRQFDRPKRRLIRFGNDRKEFDIEIEIQIERLGSKTSSSGKAQKQRTLFNPEGVDKIDGLRVRKLNRSTIASKERL
jgi:hypothetical protein